MSSKGELKSTKSERTKGQILSAARHLFAEHGYDGTTVRDIAQRASIDPAMVIRYFRSKEELFARAATIDLRLPDLRSVSRGRIGDVLVRHFLDIWEGAGKAMPILLRSAASNEFAAGKVREVFAAQVGLAIAPLGDRASASRRAGLVASQLLGLAMCRYILEIPPVVAMSRDEIIEAMAPTLQRYATYPDQ